MFDVHFSAADFSGWVWLNAARCVEDATCVQQVGSKCGVCQADFTNVLQRISSFCPSTHLLLSWCKRAYFNTGQFCLRVGNTGMLLLCFDPSCRGRWKDSLATVDHKLNVIRKSHQYIKREMFVTQWRLVEMMTDWMSRSLQFNLISFSPNLWLVFANRTCFVIIVVSDSVRNHLCLNFYLTWKITESFIH